MEAKTWDPPRQGGQATQSAILLSAAELPPNTPSTLILANTFATYQRNVYPFDRWYSDGTQLRPAGDPLNAPWVNGGTYNANGVGDVLNTLWAALQTPGGTANGITVAGGGGAITFGDDPAKILNRLNFSSALPTVTWDANGVGSDFTQISNLGGAVNNAYAVGSGVLMRLQVKTGTAAKSTGVTNKIVNCVYAVPFVVAPLVAIWTANPGAAVQQATAGAGVRVLDSDCTVNGFKIACGASAALANSTEYAWWAFVLGVQAAGTTA
jgi:hypothetical protein